MALEGVFKAEEVRSATYLDSRDSVCGVVPRPSQRSRWVKTFSSFMRFWQPGHSTRPSEGGCALCFSRGGCPSSSSSSLSATTKSSSSSSGTGCTLRRLCERVLLLSVVTPFSRGSLETAFLSLRFLLGGSFSSSASSLGWAASRAKVSKPVRPLTNVATNSSTAQLRRNLSSWSLVRHAGQRPSLLRHRRMQREQKVCEQDVMTGVSKKSLQT